MVGDVDDGSLEAMASPAVEERDFNQPGRLVMQQAVPPSGRDKLG